MRSALTLSVLLVLGCVGAEEEKKKEPAASELLTAGLVQAQQQDKPVFLLFGSPG